MNETREQTVVARLRFNVAFWRATHCRTGTLDLKDFEALLSAFDPDAEEVAVPKTAFNLTVEEKVANAQQFVRDHPGEEWQDARVLAYDVEYLAERLRLVRADLDRALVSLSDFTGDA